MDTISVVRERQSRSSNWFSFASTEVNWSMMPQGTPANSCSARWQSNAFRTGSIARPRTASSNVAVATSRAALLESPALENFSGRVSDSGEGRWTILAAIDESAPAPVLSAALYQRFSSRGEGDFAGKLLSAMRYQFGGHVERKGDH